MFSRLALRLATGTTNESENEPQTPGQGRKRPADPVETTLADTPQQTPAKRGHFELEDSENMPVILPDHLVNYVNKYLDIHVSDKAIKENILFDHPIPTNMQQPRMLDVYIKELLSEHGKRNVITSDQIYMNIQKSIHCAFGPLSSVWVAAYEEKESLDSNVPSTEGSETNEIVEEEKDRMNSTCFIMDAIVSTIAQASQRVTYFRRMQVLESLLGDSKKAKDMLADNELLLQENKSQYLFGEKFEEQVCKNSKSKKHSKDVFTALQGGSSTNRRPFRGGPLSHATTGRGRSFFKFGRGFSFRGSDTNRGSYRRGKSLLSFYNSKFSLQRLSKGASFSKNSICSEKSTCSSSGTSKVFYSQLGETNLRPRDSQYSERLQNSFLSKTLSEEGSKSDSNEFRETTVSRQGNSGVITKRGYPGGGAMSRPVCKFFIFSGKEGWRTETSNKSEGIKSPYSLCTLQNGGVTFAEGNSSERRFPLQNRLKGRIFCSASPSGIAKICQIQMERQTLSVLMPMLRFGTSSSHLYKIDEDPNSHNQKIERADNNLPRRYLDNRVNSRGSVVFKGHSNFSVKQFRFPIELKEICSGSLSGARVSRCECRYSSNDGFTSTGKSRQDKNAVFSHSSTENGVYKRIDSAVRTAVFNRNGSAPSTNSVQKPTASTNLGLENDGFLRVSNNSGEGYQEGSRMVGIKPRFEQWSISDICPSPGPSSNRCIHDRVGGKLPRPINRRALVSGGEKGAHKFPGIKSGIPSHCDFHREVEIEVGSPSDGQHGSLVLYQEDGRNHKQKYVPFEQTDLGVSYIESDHDYCGTFVGSSQQGSRLGVSPGGQERVEIEPFSISCDLQKERISRSGSVCIPSLSPSEGLLFLEDGPVLQGNGCISTELEKSPGLCFSTIQSNRQSPKESSSGTSKHFVDNTSLASPSLVPKTFGDVYKKPNIIAEAGEFVKKHRESVSSSRIKQDPSVSSMDSLRKDLTAEGISTEAATLIIQARRSGTRSHYDSSWRKWASWCCSRKVDPIRSSLNYVLEFLTEQHKLGLEWSTIAGYRSSISGLHDPVNGCPIGKHPGVSALMKGIYNQNPPKPKFCFIWDVDQVLRYLITLETNLLDIKMLTFKLTMLLALTSASRASEICQLSLQYMRKTTSDYSFTLAKPTKVHKPGSPFPVLVFTRFTENEELCVCHTLDRYIEKTANNRKGENQVLLALLSPFKKVCTQTVSRWLKEVLKLAGIDTKHFNAHSTRAASTSKAAKLGVSIKEIMEAAHWSNESTFHKFYNKSSKQSTNQFQAAVIGGFKQR